MGMDVNKIIEIIKNTPQELWQDERTIRGIIEKLENESGKTYSEDQKNKYVQQFKRFAGDPTTRRLLPFLIKSGKLEKIIRNL